MSCRFMFTTHLVINVKYTFLDLFVYFLSSIYESFFHVCCRFSRGLHKDETVLSGKYFAFFFFHFTTRLQITR